MPLDHYPRIIFAVSIHLDRVLDLRKLQSNPNLKQTCENCRTPDTGHSQQFAVPLIQAGIQGLFFPSVHAGGDLNLVVYLDNLDNGNTIQIVNEESFRENAKRLILPKP